MNGFSLGVRIGVDVYAPRKIEIRPEEKKEEQFLDSESMTFKTVDLENFKVQEE